MINLSLEFGYFSLGDLVKIKYGKNQKKVQDDENGPYPIYGTGGLMGYSKEYLYDKPSVLIGRKGSIEKVRYIDEPFWTVDTLFYTEVNENIVIPKFLYYLMSLMDLSRYNEGTSIPSLRTETLNRLEFPIPNLKYQNKVLSILNNIDKKISNNKQINNNLEEQLSLIFDDNFVKCSAYDEESLIKTDWGKIPKEWRNIDVGDIIQITSGDRPEEKSETKTAEFNIPLFGASKIMGYTKEFSYNEDILIIGRVGTHGVIQRVNYPCFPSDNTFVIKSEYYGFVYQLLKRIDYDSLNTGSTQPLITQKSLKRVNVVLPDEYTLSEFEDISKIIFDKIHLNQQEILSLTKLRDILLPKLMSGEIDVSEVNCDLKLFIKKFILILINYFGVLKMKTKIISKIQKQMKPFLNQYQYLKLTNSLLNSLKDIEIIDNNNESNENDNFKLLNSFLSAKQVEGRSEKTIIYYKSTLEKMLTKIGKQVYNITTDDIRKYLFNHKKEKNSSKITIDNMRRIFSSFFSWLEDEDYILKNPVRRIHRVKTGRVVKEVLTDENLEILRDNCNEIRDLAMVEILISTGIRVGELVKLNIDDINFYERECIVFGKGESERVVYFDARTKIHLMKYLETRTDNNPALFVSLNKPYERLGISGVETRLRELGRKCNIHKVHPHKFRRTLATNAIDKGMPIEQVQKLMGHVQIDTTMQYAMVNQSNVKIAHRKFIG